MNRDFAEHDKQFKVSWHPNNLICIQITACYCLGKVSCCSLPMMHISTTCLSALHSEDYFQNIWLQSRRGIKATLPPRAAAGPQQRARSSTAVPPSHLPSSPLPPPVSTLPPLGRAVSMTTVWVGGCRGVRQGHYWEESTRDAALHIQHLHLIQF